MGEVASAFVSLLPSMKGFGAKTEQGLSGELGSRGKKLGSVLGGAMKVGALGAFAAGGVFLKGALDEARDAQKVGALTASTIKATGGAAKVTAKQVGDLAGAISVKTGIDDETIQSGQNMLLTFKNIRNEAGKGNDIFNQTSQTLVDMSAAMGTDPKRAAIGLGKALNDPIKGVTALSRVGVTFTDQQKEQIKTLVDSGKTVDAQKIILKELSSEFGGAAEAQATAGDKMKVAFGNLQETVGTALLPAWDAALNKGTDFLLFLTNGVGPAVSSVSKFLAPAAAAIKGFFSGFDGGGAGGGLLSTFGGLAESIKANFLPVLQTAAKTFTSTVLPAVLKIATSIRDNFLPVLQSAATTFTTVVLPAVAAVASYLMAKLAPIFTQVAGIISTHVVPIVASLAKFFYGTLYPAVVAIATSVASKLKPVLDQLFATIQSKILPTITKVLAKFREWMPTIQKVVVVVLKVVGVLLNLAAAILGKVLPPLIRFAGFLIGVVVGAVLGVIGVVLKIISVVIDMGTAWVNGVKKVAQFVGGLKTKVGEAIGYVAGIPGKVLSALGDLGSTLYNAGKELIQGLINGIRDMLPDIGGAMGGIADKVKGFLPGSPVKEGPLRSWNNGGAGKRLVGLLADGLSDTRPVDQAMRRLSSGISVRSPRLDPSVIGHGAGAGRGGGPLVGNLHVTTPQGSTTHDVVSRLVYELRMVQRSERWA